MTTLSSSTAISNATTAAMRVWGVELNGWLSTVGLVQTADTGQVNWSTVTLPGGGSIIGYEVWRFADSSIYFKIEYWANSTPTGGTIFWLTVGTGSNGSGAITGQSTPRTQIGLSNNASYSGGSFPTYICCTADFFGIAYKCGSVAVLGSNMGFAIEKTVDSAGAVTTTGYCVSYNFGATTPTLMNKIAVRTVATALTYATSQSFCAVPGNVTSSTNLAGNKSAYLHTFQAGDPLLSNYLFTYVSSEAAQGVTIQATLVGATQHTYIALTNALGTGNSSSAATTWGTMMLWE